MPWKPTSAGVGTIFEVNFVVVGNIFETILTIVIILKSSLSELVSFSN